MNLKTTFFKFLLLLSILLPQAARSQLIVNGGFNISTPMLPFTGSCAYLYGWTSEPGRPVQWESKYNNSNWWVDMTGCDYGTGRWIEQTVPTVPGQVYTLAYNLGCWRGFNNTDAGVSVYLNGVFHWEDHYINFTGIPPGIPLKWGRFTHCFVAKSTSTTIRFVCESDISTSSPFSPPGTVPEVDDWYGAAVVGFDSVTLDSTGYYIDLTLSDTCASVDNEVTMELGGSLSWYGNWYKNGAYQGAGSNLVVNDDGHYRIEIPFGDCVVRIDTFIKNCCRPTIEAQQFCKQSATNFTIDFPESCEDCIGSMDISYGDGTVGNITGNQANYQFNYQYGWPGTYKVKFCWLNSCTDMVKCDSTTVTIIDCDTCWPDIDTAHFCLGEMTTFDIQFPDYCTDCLSDINIFFGDAEGNSDNSGNHSDGLYHFEFQYAAAGTYEVVYCWYDACRKKERCDTVIIVIDECPCDPVIEVENLCSGKPTNFHVEFPEGHCRECITEIVVLADGLNYYFSGASPGFDFPIIFNTPGPRPVTFCWTNNCTGVQTCTTLTVNIEACPCEPVIGTDYFCLGQNTEVLVHFPDDCSDCISQVIIDYGDGSAPVSISGSIQTYLDHHIYAATGTYTAQVCYTNTCNGTTLCINVPIIIRNCVCDPLINSSNVCLNDPTEFTIDFPGDCYDCIGNVTINYGDGANDITVGSQTNYTFDHSYSAAGTYSVEICWFNSCTNTNQCSTIQVVKRVCICDPFITTYSFCAGDATNFDVIFPPDCGDCITQTTILYGDGLSDVLPGSTFSYHFSHTYSGLGTYPVQVCWYNQCLNQMLCQTIYITIIDCTPIIEGGPTGIRSNMFDENTPVIIYPNPTNGACTIDGITAKDEARTVKVYDLSGKLISEKKIAPGQTSVTINAEELKPGTYLVYVNGLNINKAFKLIKQ